MRLLLIGASGDVGRAALAELAPRHEIVPVGRDGGGLRADLTDRDSLWAMYRDAGPVDGVICCAGPVYFGPLQGMTDADMRVGLNGKLLGQIRVVIEGIDHVADGGSFTLTSGVLDREPVRGGVGAAVANGGLAGFVRAAAQDMPRGLRVNVISPGLLDVSVPRYGNMFPGHEPVPAERVGRAYARAVEGAGTGNVIVVG
ncbi:MAG: short chain dehydrogenase [Pseudomonadota bacterium]